MGALASTLIQKPLGYVGAVVQPPKGFCPGAFDSQYVTQSDVHFEIHTPLSNSMAVTEHQLKYPDGQTAFTYGASSAGTRSSLRDAFGGPVGSVEPAVSVAPLALIKDQSRVLALVARSSSATYLMSELHCWVLGEPLEHSEALKHVSELIQMPPDFVVNSWSGGHHVIIQQNDSVIYKSHLEISLSTLSYYWHIAAHVDSALILLISQAAALLRLRQ
jgi:hypothetical protein